MTHSENGFRGLGIAPGILSALDKLEFTTPTPIQEQTIPIALEGKDLMGIAQTGTGKTLAFGIPLIQRAFQHPGLSLVVAPTRELAIQITESLEEVGLALGLRTATLIGGESSQRQLRRLARQPHIVVGTPGRIIDYLKQRVLKLDGVHTLILDEADRMLDMGFAPQLKTILTYVPTERQTMLFSATMPDEIVRIARAFLKLPVRIEVARAGTMAEHITQELFFVAQESKPALLEKVLQEYRGSVLVFARTKRTAKRITAHLKMLGHTAGEIHSNKSLTQRRAVLAGFKAGTYRVLVATDIASRGIDVSNIELVVNYDLPDDADNYVHRIGRTGRAGESGHAISFAQPNQRGDVQAIERLIRASLPVSKLPNLPPPPPGTLPPERPRHYQPHYRRAGFHPQRRSSSPGGHPPRFGRR